MTSYIKDLPTTDGARQLARTELYGLLGELPPRDRPVAGKVVAVEDRGIYTMERLVLDLNPYEAVPALFCRPTAVNPPYPVVLYNHAHGGNYALGKHELIEGRPAIHNPPYAEAFARAGWASMTIDHYAFGERMGRTELGIFKELLWQGQVLWGLMVYDSIKAVDYLVSRPDIDGTRVATLGLSMGSTMAWWLAALDTRIRVCIDLCCLTDFHAILAARGLSGHGIYYFVPSLLKKFSTSAINALIAPRPHLSLAGDYDELTPPAGLEKVDSDLKAVYKANGVPEAWELVRYKTGHFENADMRYRIMAFLNRWGR